MDIFTPVEIQRLKTYLNMRSQANANKHFSSIQVAKNKKIEMYVSK